MIFLAGFSGGAFVLPALTATAEGASPDVVRPIQTLLYIEVEYVDYFKVKLKTGERLLITMSVSHSDSCGAASLQ